MVCMLEHLPLEPKLSGACAKCNASTNPSPSQEFMNMNITQVMYLSLLLSLAQPWSFSVKLLGIEE